MPLKTTDLRPAQQYRLPSGDIAEIAHVYGRGRNRKVELAREVVFPGFRSPTKYVVVSRFVLHATPVDRILPGRYQIRVDLKWVVGNFDGGEWFVGNARKSIDPESITAIGERLGEVAYV